MIHLPASVRVYLCLSPCDMRRSFNGLHALVRDHLQLDAFADIFTFSPTRDETGSNLQSGQNALRRACSQSPPENPVQSGLRSRRKSWALLSAINLKQANRPKRFQRSTA
jgi:hypothetical protein